MSNSNFSNNPGQENYRDRFKNERSNFKDRSGGRKDGGGFRIRLSDNEMNAVKSIQEAFQLRSTVAVLGFSVRTLSEMIKDEKLIESIKEYAKNNKIIRRFFFGNFMKSFKRLSLLILNTILYFSNFILMQVVNEKSKITQVVNQKIKI